MHTQLHTVFGIDDQAIVLSALQQLVESTPGLKWIGGAHSPREAIDLLRELRPHVVVADLVYPHDTGFPLLELLRWQMPAMRVVVYSSLDERAFVRRCLQLGAAGYVSKSENVDTLLNALDRATHGRLAISQHAAHQVMRGFSTHSTHATDLLDRLNVSELAVYLMMGQSMSTNEIARCLYKSPKTVETYKRHTREKLGILTGVALVQSAAQYMAGVA